jgi:hypothetical protein
MTDVVVPFPPISAARARMTAADMLRSELRRLADEAERNAFPLTATMIGLALMAIEQDHAIEEGAGEEGSGEEGMGEKGAGEEDAGGE